MSWPRDEARLKRVRSLMADRGLDAIFDPPDATRVRTDGDRIAEIGKTISAHDAIDTGFFRIGPALVGALDEAFAARGDCSLSNGVAALAARGAARVVDVTGSVWLDVDTPEALAEAERRVAAGLFD